ncbi:MAG: hypothetical protein EXS37_13115 [Opitutus sp.]|nr:hypothetical protein [Opitutus sp.]
MACIETFSIPCAEGHDVVYGLAAGAGNEIYLAASNEFCPGLCAVVFAFDTVTRKFRVVIDVGRETGFDPGSGLMPHSKIHLCLQSTRAGRVFAATHFTAPGIGQTSFDPLAAFRGQFPGCYLLEYDPIADRVINHGLLVRGEGARIACLDEKHGQYFFISYPRNHLFRYDYTARVLHDLGRVGQENAFGLEVDDDGQVYSSDDRGRIIRYSLARDRMEEMNLFVPLPPGRSPAGNYIRRMTRGGDGALYGFGNKGMHLFRLDPRAETLVDHGAIFGVQGNPGYTYPRLPPAKAMVQIDPQTLLIAFGGDGIYADDDPVPSLVEYDLVERRTTDLGRFICPENGMPAWIPQCALAVPEAAAVFFGLQQTFGPLRLWKINLPLRSVSSPASPLALRERHGALVRGRPFGASVEGADALPFVRHGHVQMHELGWRGEDRVIAPGETAIAALQFVGGTVYGVTTGRRAHLFAFRPYRQNRFTENYEVHPWDVGVIIEEPVRRAKLFHDPRRNRLVVAVETEARTVIAVFSPGAELSRYTGAYHSLTHWPPVGGNSARFEILVTIPPGGVVFENLVYLPECDGLVSTSEAGQLVRLDWGGASRPLDLAASITRHGLFGVAGDRLFAVTREGGGLLLQFDGRGHITVATTVSGLEGELTGFAVNSTGNGIALGRREGWVEILDVRSPASRRNIQLSHRWKVRALAWHPSGRLFGFYGEDEAIGEAFSVDPLTGAVREIGVLQVSSQPRYWMCHRCDAMVAGARGEVYYGEADRLAHLFAVVD